MHIPRYIFSKEEDVLVEEAIESTGLNYNKTDEYYIVSCPRQGTMNEEVVLGRVFESSSIFRTMDVLGKQYSIRAMSRLMPLLTKARTTEEKLSAIAAVNSLFPSSPEMALRLINMVPS